MTRQLEYIRRSTKGFNEKVDKVFEKLREEKREDDQEIDESILNLARGDAGAESIGGFEGPDASIFEAIILAELRPAYFIVDDKIQMSDSPVDEDPVLVAAINDNKDNLEKIGKSVGRVDLLNHRSLEYAGTGWLIADDIAVTNRHVARVFAETDWSGQYRFKKGIFNNDMEARLNYLKQHGGSPGRRRAEVLEVLYIAASHEADIAFLRVDNRDETEPLELLDRAPASGTPIAAIGYPAKDGGRNDPDLMEKLFTNTYNVKRFSPGYVTGTEESGLIVTSDYTSLGGNSGSPVIDLETGKAVALHFAGAFRDANYAVAADIVSAARASITTRVKFEAPTEDPTSGADKFAGRDGYQSAFLGDDGLDVPLPNLGAWASDVAPVSDDDDDVLKYRHFSVIQSKSRRFPLITAVNIDGDKAFTLKRKGSWKLDGRLQDDHQIGNVIYKNNPLDRGHLVRRMDPGWGDSREEAQEGEIDTFHYTVSAPQHKNLNQKDWLGLEDHILGHAKTKDFKVSVFTGPVFRDGDKTLRNQPGAEDIPIPEEFWKIAVMINADTDELSATGYVLSQGEMIRDMTEAAFVFGEFKTYQVQIAKIEAETGLDFGKLRDADPLGAELDTESPFGEVAFEISGPESLQLG